MESEKDSALNPMTMNNLNDFYIQGKNDNDNEHVFNLSNFYKNHGKYFSGNSIYKTINYISSDYINPNGK